MSEGLRSYVVKITPERGPNAGKPYRIMSGDKITLDPGAGADHMAGFGQGPFAVVVKSSKPKATVDNIAADELQAVLAHVGGIGGYPFTLSCVSKRPGIASRTFSVSGMEIGEGGDVNVDDAGSKGKLGGPAMDIKYAVGNAPLRSIYAKPNGH
jgi:hypothetical protein